MRSCWTPRPGRRLPGVHQALTALPDDADILLAAVDDGAALGAAAAIPAARAEHITMAAIGADQRARCEIIDQSTMDRRRGVVPGSLRRNRRSRPARRPRGQEIPRNMFVDTTFITADCWTRLLRRQRLSGSVTTTLGTHGPTDGADPDGAGRHRLLAFVVFSFSIPYSSPSTT